MPFFLGWGKHPVVFASSRPCQALPSQPSRFLETNRRLLIHDLLDRNPGRRIFHGRRGQREPFFQIIFVPSVDSSHSSKGGLFRRGLGIHVNLWPYCAVQTAWLTCFHLREPDAGPSPNHANPRSQGTSSPYRASWHLKTEYRHPRSRPVARRLRWTWTVLTPRHQCLPKRRRGKRPLSRGIQIQ